MRAAAVDIELLPLLLDPYDDLATGVEGAFAQAAEDLETTGWRNLCPVATVSAEVADTEPELREVAADVITHSIHEGSRYFTRRGLSDTDARSAIYALVGGLEVPSSWLAASGPGNRCTQRAAPQPRTSPRCRSAPVRRRGGLVREAAGQLPNGPAVVVDHHDGQDRRRRSAADRRGRVLARDDQGGARAGPGGRAD